MQYYFIGGLGGNSYHLAPLMDELGFPVTFLEPYREMIQTENDLRDWFQGRVGQAEEICLFGHSLGGDLARYLASEFPQIQALILLDGGYLDMEKILPLEEELEGTSSFMQQQVFATLEEAVLSELGDGADPTHIARKAVEASYRWNPANEQYELNLDLEKVMALFTSTASDQDLPDSIGRPACPLYWTSIPRRTRMEKRCSEATRSPDQASLARRFGARTVYRGARNCS